MSFPSLSPSLLSESFTELLLGLGTAVPTHKNKVNVFSLSP